MLKQWQTNKHLERMQSSVELYRVYNLFFECLHFINMPQQQNVFVKQMQMGTHVPLNVSQAIFLENIKTKWEIQRKC